MGAEGLVMAQAKNLNRGGAIRIHPGRQEGRVGCPDIVGGVIEKKIVLRKWQMEEKDKDSNQYAGSDR
jgi:hypothetical protein